MRFGLRLTAPVSQRAMSVLRVFSVSVQSRAAGARCPPARARPFCNRSMQADLQTAAVVRKLTIQLAINALV